MTSGGKGNNAAARAPLPATLRVWPGEPRGEISPWLYGQFLEHILSSVDGGLHAELLTERRFALEPMPADEVLQTLPAARGLEVATGDWRSADGCVTQIARQVHALAWFAAAPAAGNFTVRARMLSVHGQHGGGIVLESATGAQVRCALHNFFTTPRVLLREPGPAAHERVLSEETNMVTPGHALDQMLVVGRWVETQLELGNGRLRWTINGTLRHDVALPGLAFTRIGLESAHTQVAFADVAVRDAAGHVVVALQADATPSAVARMPAFGWDALEGVTTATCRFARRRTAPTAARTNLHAEVFAAAPAPVGICQGALAMQQGRALRGSVHLRAETSNPAIEVGLRARKSHETLAAVMITGIDATWRIHEFELISSADCADAEFYVRFAAPGVYDLAAVSLVPAAAGTPPLRRDLLEAIRALHPTIIRWPGGCFCWVYDWKHAIGPRAQRQPAPVFDWTGDGGTDSNDFGTDEFIAFCRAVGAEPLLVINMNLGVQHALDWLEYCNGAATTPWGAQRTANGHPAPYHVRCWAIDNERWGYGAARYAQLAAEFVAAMRARQPDAHIWLVGSNLEPNLAFGAAAENHFGTEVVRRTPDQAELVSLHGYWGRCAWERLAVANVRIEEYLQKEIAAYRAAGGTRAKIALDEWNPGTTDYQSGIAAALLLNTLERQCGAVGMASPALWLRHVKHGDAWDNALINFDHRGWYPSVTYLVNQLWSENRCPQLVQAETTAPMLMLDGVEVPVLDAVATADPADGRVVIKTVNRDATRAVALTVDMGSAACDGHAIVTVLAHDQLDDRNTLAQPDKIRPQTRHVPVTAGQMTMTLPPVSAALIVLRAAHLPAD